jgi:hypothetical protein
MATIANRTANASVSNGANQATGTQSLTVSAGTNRRAVVLYSNESAVTIDSATFNGQAATAVDVELSFNGCKSRAFYYNIPDVLGAGAYNWVVTCSGNHSQRHMASWQLEGVDTAVAPTWATNTAGTGGNTVAVSINTDADDVLMAMGINGAAATTITGSSSQVTLSADAVANDAFRSTVNDAIADATESVTVTYTQGNTSTSKAAVAMVHATAVAGPTITVQPANDVGIISNGQSTVYTGTATGTTISAFTWEVDGTPIADGGIYDIVTTGIGTGSASSTLTITRTDKTGTPFDINFDVTDANGTTASNTVTDTWWTGPVLTTFPATDGSGESTATLTSDYVTGVGEAIEVRIPLSDGDVAVTVTTT